MKGRQKQEQTFIDKPDVNYRKIDALNQSMLKTFDSDPVKFFEEFKLGKKREDKKNTALIIGDLVDFHLLECGGDEEIFENRFDEKFALFEGNKGSGQIFILVDQLMTETKNCLSDEGIVTLDFEERFNDAFKKVTSLKDGDGNQKYFKGKTTDKALELFQKDGQEYWNSLITNIGKTVVDISIVDKAKYIANNMLTDSFSREIFQADDQKEIVTHFPIEWDYAIDDEKFIKCKAEIDRLEIDHEHKIIQLDDLKTTYDNESFDYMYIKNAYYLQNAFYHKAVQFWAENEGGLKGYKVTPMRFIVGDTSANNRRPLIYITSLDDLTKGIYGFSLRGNLYRGVNELIDDIVWAEENNEWRASREAVLNDGKIKLDIKYD